MADLNCRQNIALTLCVLHVTFTVASSSFVPQDRLFIDCGGSEPLELDDGRVFEPDSWNQNVAVSANSAVVDSGNQTVGPNGLSFYNSARVFAETAVYNIATEQSFGQHWVRLHFYPIENPHYDLRSAVFSVVANGITLLHRFSLSKIGNVTFVAKEYVVVSDPKNPKSMVIKLFPWSGSIAFVNGIEVVSVPNRQFPSSAMPIPIGTEVEIPNDIAFETLYRVNMGGPLITPKNGSLWRTWEPDLPHLLNPVCARNVTGNPSLVKFPEGASPEIAPNWVYATAQEMADANVSRQKFNISWEFEVQSGFSYLVRMHFCDIVSVALGSLVFNVYVNEQYALDTFDISSRTNMELSAAYFADFVANLTSGSGGRILVQVGPSDLGGFQSNAILNGLEIMKMSNGIGSLDGNLPTDDFDSKSSNKKKWSVLEVTSASIGLVVLVLIIAALFFFFFGNRRKTGAKKPKRQFSSWLSAPTSNIGLSDSKLSVGSSALTVHSLGLGRILSFSEIREATRNFDESLVLGVGGFGKVYKGILENGNVVAVKRGNPRSQQGLTEFRTEIQMLSKLRHRHLVSLIGYCEELNEMILVYEYMAGGPLRKHLYGSSDLPPLSWKQRLDICIGAAKGLHYLHTGAADVIIHRDVKTTNILLDENLAAKVADFGLSKLGPTLDQTHVSTAVKGSFGYLDPEYYRRQRLTEKSDVYSFGVVLMEILCARPAINPALPREQVNIAEWAMSWQRRGKLEKVIDPWLAGTINAESLRKFAETAEKCLAEHGAERPAMGDVLWNLEYALQLHEASAAASAESSAVCIHGLLPEWAPGAESGGGEAANGASDRASDATSSAVFSQLMDPKGR